MDRNVFLSLLSMDAYNRKGDRRIILDSRDGGATKIGDAALVDRALSQNYDPSGFYAFDYVLDSSVRVAGMAAGEKVISYRGTDDPAEDFWSYGICAGTLYNSSRLWRGSGNRMFGRIGSLCNEHHAWRR
jgi:hypothetical protein